MVIARFRSQYGLEQQTTVVPIAESSMLAVGAYLSHSQMAPGTRKALAAALRAMADDGTVYNIYRNYVPEEMAKAIAKP